MEALPTFGQAAWRSARHLQGPRTFSLSHPRPLEGRDFRLPSGKRSSRCRGLCEVLARGAGSRRRHCVGRTHQRPGRPALRLLEQAGQDNRGVSQAQFPTSRSSGCELVKLFLPPEVRPAAQGEFVHREPHSLEEVAALQRSCLPC